MYINVWTNIYCALAVAALCISGTGLVLSFMTFMLWSKS